MLKKVSFQLIIFSFRLCPNVQDQWIRTLGILITSSATERVLSVTIFDKHISEWKPNRLSTNLLRQLSIISICWNSSRYDYYFCYFYMIRKSKVCKVQGKIQFYLVIIVYKTVINSVSICLKMEGNLAFLLLHSVNLHSR